MNTYRITITDKFFKKELTSEYEFATPERAIAWAREIYAVELDTTEDQIEILSVIKIR